MRGGLLCFLFLFSNAFAEDKSSSPTKLFISAIQERQKSFVDFREKFFKEEICPALDYTCVNKNLRELGIKTSGDLSNGVSILNFIIQKKFKKGDCQEICKMNLFAEYSSALVDFFSLFDRKSLLVNKFPPEHPETKYLVINEELNAYKILSHYNEKLISYRKKIDPTKIFRPELMKRMESIDAEIQTLKASERLKGAYLSTLKSNDELLKRIVNDFGKNEKERTERRDLVTAFRQEVK